MKHFEGEATNKQTLTTNLSASLTQAVEIIKNDGVVGMPTETVYGLAGSIYSEIALKKIFQIKERPFFDPLIVHVHELAQVYELVSSFDPVSKTLAEEFWPGPLTLILPKSEKVSELITAGSPQVAIRCPRHPVALELISKVGSPLAAPSANKFGKTSPTSAQHVLDEFREEVYVIEGGDSEVGIESTILEVRKSEEECVIKIHRPGIIGVEELKNFILNKSIFKGIFKKVSFEFLQGYALSKGVVSSDVQQQLYSEDGSKKDSDPQSQEFNESLSPGQLNNHYQPKRPLVLLSNKEDLDDEMISLIKNSLQKKGIKIKNTNNYKELVLPTDPVLAARLMYAQLRELGESNLDFIYFQKSILETPQWYALRDRLYKAASLII